MEKAIVRTAKNEVGYSGQLYGELVRKSLHLLIALVPLMASINLRATMFILGFGTLSYVFAEHLRMSGRPVFIISNLTILASRKRDQGYFVLGPVTLGLGAMLALLLYPSTAAAIAIYALAFGDGLASIAGRILGNRRLPFTGGKTLAGSLTCFLAVAFSTYYLTGNLGATLGIAAAATFFESLPLGDFDNLVLPVGTGFIATSVLF
ncbi:MAG TPA: phosphatidate cytidylyltransferase [bacterium]|nr:phosphatidate cytidylyltransferase [bacterium]